MSAPKVCISEASQAVLQELSAKTGRPIQDILDQAIDDYRRKVFLEAVNAGYAALRADPEAWAEVQRERASMAGSLMDGLDPNERWGENGDLLPRSEGKNDG
jgi:hypothetical protein